MKSICAARSWSTLSILAVIILACSVFAGINSSVTLPSTGGGGAAQATSYVTGFNIDATDTTIATGSKWYFRVPTSGTMAWWVLRTDRTSTTVVSIAHCPATNFPSATNITASAPMALNLQKALTNAALTGWMTNVVAGDYLKYTVLTNSHATNLAVEITINIP